MLGFAREEFRRNRDVGDLVFIFFFNSPEWFMGLEFGVWRGWTNE